MYRTPIRGSTKAKLDAAFVKRANALYAARRSSTNAKMALARARALAGVPRQVPRGFVGAAGDAKFADFTLDQAAVNTTATIQHVSIIAQGTTVNTRIGKACRAKSFRMRGNVKVDAAHLQSTCTMHLVWDYQPNKALAAVTDILDTGTVNSFPKRENAARFKVLKTWRYALDGNGNAPVYASTFTIDDYIKMPKDANILYTSADSTGVIGDVIQGALLFITVGDVAPGTADIALVCNGRLNFVESLYGPRLRR